jgi:hypothetical protein
MLCRNSGVNPLNQMALPHQHDIPQYLIQHIKTHTNDKLKIFLIIYVFITSQKAFNRMETNYAKLANRVTNT